MYEYTLFACRTLQRVNVSFHKFVVKYCTVLYSISFLFTNLQQIIFCVFVFGSAVRQENLNVS